MEYTKTIENNQCKIKMNGKFTFNDHVEFKKIFTILEECNVTSVDFNLSNIDFVDSAALGLFLLLRDEMQKQSVNLTLSSPQGQVKKMLHISKFYDLFNIVE